MTTNESTERIPASLRTEALEQLLTERGLVDPNVLDAIITDYETNVGPLNGARVIAKAWTDRKNTRGEWAGDSDPAGRAEPGDVVPVWVWVQAAGSRVTR